ncbi:uncharacterized protein LOC109614079 [Musca domestica]|uniref:Uncharacterized protein LOC109614079 n=1 Tax=Musca domestica TaxID=7370 RepID=A0ABM3V7Z0_MUSDO|nr:uncharacterized protein LOC109614079 [Musca domestica]
MADYSLPQIIHNFNEHLNIEWNLLISQNEITAEIETMLKDNTRPVAIIAESMEEREKFKSPIWKDDDNNKFLYEIFPENSLVIVNVQKGSDKHNFLYMANITKYHLKRMYFIYIVWIVNGAKIDDILDYAQTCWNYGFTKVLFFGNNTLYTYNMFPSLEVESVQHLQDYFNRDEIVNFHQYPLTFAITSSPPRCFRYIDRHGRVAYTGYMYHMLMTFIEYFNFTFEEYPHDYHDDDKVPLLNALIMGNMDFSAFPPYPNRSLFASDVLWFNHIRVIVPNASPIDKYKYFVRPFDGLVWLLYCLIIVAASLNLALFVYVKYFRWEVSKSFMYICSLSLFQYQLPIPVQSWRFNLLYILLLIYSFIMINYYLCILSSLLVLTIYENQIETFEDLGKTSWRLKATQEDIDYYSSVSNISPIILNISLAVDGIVLDSLRRNLSVLSALNAYDDKLEFYLYQQRYLKVPRVRMIKPVVLSSPFFFGMRHNLPYMKLFNRFLMNLASSGLLWKFYFDMELNGILSGELHYLKDGEDGDHLLSLEYFYAPICLYCFGSVLSAFVFLFEILYFKCSKKMFRKKNR